MKLSCWGSLVFIFCHVSTLECGGTFRCSVCVFVLSHVQEPIKLLFAAMVGDFILISLCLWTWSEECLYLHRADLIPEGREEPTCVVGLFSLHICRCSRHLAGLAQSVPLHLKQRVGKWHWKGMLSLKPEYVQTEVLPNPQKYCLCELLRSLHKAKVLPQTFDSKSPLLS